MRAPREGEFAAVKRGAALAFRDQAGTCLAFDLGEDLRLFVTVHQPSQHRGFVVGLRDQPDKGAVVDRVEPQTPPRSAST